MLTVREVVAALSKVRQDSPIIVNSGVGSGLLVQDRNGVHYDPLDPPKLTEQEYQELYRLLKQYQTTYDLPACAGVTAATVKSRFNKQYPTGTID